jgi:hypothetical protein
MRARLRWEHGKETLTILNVIDIGMHLDWLTATEDILKALLDSKENGNVIGITALSFGPTMIMTAVDDVVDVKNDKIVLLKETDLLGIKLPESELLLSEIVRVHPLRTKYNDPFHARLRGERPDPA